MQHLPIGLQFDRLRIESVLGAGGSGVTYRARDVESRRISALKEYFPEKLAVRAPDGRVFIANKAFEVDFRHGLDRFIAEAEMLATFRSDHIVRIERIFGAMGTGMIQLENLTGPTVAVWSATAAAPAGQQAVDAFAGGLIEALATIHRGGVLHFDISPRNILLRDNGLPVLIDFGSARRIIGTLSGTTRILVTPHYAPQELYISSGARRGPWTDIYSAGAVLYLLVTGAPPPDSPARAMNPRVPVEFSAAVRATYRADFLDALAWSLEFSPEARPRSVEEWRPRLSDGATATGIVGLPMPRIVQ